MGDILKTVAGGGQTWAHRVRMLRQVTRITLSLALLGSLGLFAFKISKEPKHRFAAIFYFCQAGLSSAEETSVSANFAEAITGKKYYAHSVRIGTNELQRVAEEELFLLWQAAKYHLKRSLLLGGGIFLSFLLFFFLRGKQAKQKKLLSGQAVRHRNFKKIWARGGIRIGHAVLPKKHETKHILVSGSTGSGKSNAIHHLIPQMRERKQKLIIVDTTGDYIARYYNPEKDFILNPFDRRSQAWHPWGEIKQTTDFKAIARCFIPIPEEKHSPDIFWSQAASTIFESLLQKTFADQNLAAFQALLLTRDLSILHEKIEGTKGAPFVAKEGEKLAHSIRATLSNRVECLEYLTETKTPFSISSWLKEEGESALFLSCIEQQRDNLIPLLSAQFGIAIKSLMSLGSDYRRRVWFVNDELAAMGAISGLPTLLREGRKYGASALLATQNPAQLDSIYGRAIAEDLFSNLRTKLVFAEEDPKIAKRLSLLFGEKEVLEAQEGISYGAHEMRDGVTHSMLTRQRPIIPATEIQTLQDNACFLKVCGGEAIERIQFQYLEGEKRAEPFQEREGALDVEVEEKQEEAKEADIEPNKERVNAGK